MQTLANRRIGIMLPLGFASGLPLALTSGTLQAWLTVVGFDLKTIYRVAPFITVSSADLNARRGPLWQRVKKEER